MSTSPSFRDYIAEQLAPLGDVTLRPMMGEYLLYYHGVLIGGIYNERLLIKESLSAEKYHLPQVLPYDTAKRTMYHVEDIDDREKLAEIIAAVYEDLHKSTPKKNPSHIKHIPKYCKPKSQITLSSAPRN